MVHFFLALTSSGSIKNLNPILTCWELNNDTVERLSHVNIEVGLEDMAAHLFMDQESKLIFVADDARIKSFSLASSPEGTTGLPVHTMRPLRFQGPLWVIRGKGSLALWSVDALNIHGTKASELIGEEHSVDSDAEDVIEMSSGDPHHQTALFSDENLMLWRWHAHFSKPGTMICGSDPIKPKRYALVTLDIENGKTADVYLGHGGGFQRFSTSETDPHAFVTARDDGYARLFDTFPLSP